MFQSYFGVIFVQGIYQKAETLYSMGDFEQALVFYHRGLQLRPGLEQFRLGIQKAEESIRNSVGSALYSFDFYKLFSCICEYYKNKLIIRIYNENKN